MLCWGLTSGNAGMVAQVRALAAVIGENPVMKTVDIRKQFSWIPNLACATPLRNAVVPYLIAPGSDKLEQPWPDLVISCGRRAAMVAIGLRARIKDGNTRFIHIQDPQVSSRYFDLVVAMAHDKINGTNVIKTNFALHYITPDILRAAEQRFSSRFSEYPKPHIAVLLGGSTNKYEFSKESMAQVVMSLQQLLQRTKGSLLITPSRRTGDENMEMLRNSFANNPRVYIYDFIEENPYLGMLALADTIVVTNDSVNMMSEAQATGKPIYILPLPGHVNTKPSRFAEGIIADGIARQLRNNLESWTYPILNEMEWLAQEVKNRLA